MTTSSIQQAEQKLNLSQLNLQWPKKSKEQEQWLLQLTRENLIRLIQYLAQASKLKEEEDLIEQIIKSLLRDTTPLLKLLADTETEDLKKILNNLCEAYNNTKLFIALSKTPMGILQDLFTSNNSEELNKFIINVLPNQLKLIRDESFINKLKENLGPDFIRYFILAIKTDKLSGAVNSLRINSKEDFDNLYNLLIKNNSGAPAKIAWIFANMAKINLHTKDALEKIKQNLIDPKNQPALITFLWLAAQNKQMQEAIDGIGIEDNLKALFLGSSDDLQNNVKLKQLIEFLDKGDKKLDDILKAEPINSLKQNLIADKLLLFALLNASSQEQGPKILAKLGLNAASIQTLLQEKESLLALTYSLITINTNSYFWSCISQSSTNEPLISPEKKTNEFKQKLFLPNNRSQLLEFLLIAAQNNKLTEAIQKLDIETQLKNLLTNNENLVLLAQLWACMPESAMQQLTDQKDIVVVKAQLLEPTNLPQLFDLLRTANQDSELLNKLGINSYLEKLFLKKNELEIFLYTSNTDYNKPKLLVDFLSKAPNDILSQDPIESLKNNLINDTSLLFTLLLTAATEHKLSEIIRKLNITTKLTDFFATNLAELVYFLACLPYNSEEITKLCEITGQKNIRNLEAAQEYIERPENYPLLTELLEKAAANNNLTMIIKKLKINSNNLYNTGVNNELLEKNIKLLASNLDLKTLLSLLHLNDIAWSIANNNSSQLNNNDIQHIKTNLLANSVSELLTFLNKAKQNNVLSSAIDKLDIGPGLENLLQNPMRLLSFLTQIPANNTLLDDEPIQVYINEFKNNDTNLLSLLTVAIETGKLSLIIDKLAVKDKLATLFNNSNLEVLARILMSIQNDPAAKLTLLQTAGQGNLEAFKAQFLTPNNQPQLKNFLTEIAKDEQSLSSFVKALEITNYLDAPTLAQEPKNQETKLQQIKTFLSCFPDDMDSEVIRGIKTKLQLPALPVSEIQKSIKQDQNPEINKKNSSSINLIADKQPSYTSPIIEPKSDNIPIKAILDNFQRYVNNNIGKKPWGAKKQMDGSIKYCTEYVKKVAASAQHHQDIIQTIISQLEQISKSGERKILSPYLQTAINQAINFMQLQLPKPNSIYNEDKTKNPTLPDLTSLCINVKDPVNPTKKEKAAIKTTLTQYLHLLTIATDNNTALIENLIKLQQQIDTETLPLPQTDNPQIDLAVAILSRARYGIIKKGDFEITRSLKDISSFITSLNLQQYIKQDSKKESSDIQFAESPLDGNSINTTKCTPVAKVSFMQPE